MAFSFVLCRSTGEPLGEALTAQARELDFRLNGVHTAKLSIPLADDLAGELAPGLARLKVYRSRSAAELAADPGAERELVFYGLLPAENVREMAGPELIQATFVDPRWVLDFRFTIGIEGGTAADQGAIIWNLIDTQHTIYDVQGGETWIRQGSTSTGVLRDRTYDTGKNLAGLIDDLTKVIDGPDVDIVPRDGYSEDPATREMADLNVYANQGEDLPGVHFLYGAGYPSNVGDVQRTYLPITTYAFATGTAADGTAVLAAAQVNLDTYGQLQERISEPDVQEFTTLTQKVQGIVAERGSPREVISVSELTPDAPRPFEHFYLGDTVRVSCRKGAMVFTDRPLRIHGFKVSIDQTGDLGVNLTTAT